jgi:hypothetical protein
MLQQMTELMPGFMTGMAPELAMGIAAGGVLLGVFGARLTRSIIPLALVAAGTLIGLHMPHWFGWKIDRMGTAFGAAIILGLSGYMLSTMWEGILFGTLLATGAAVTVWLALVGSKPWHPDVNVSGTAAEAAWQIWSYNKQYTVAWPLAIGTGLGFALGATMLASWPRLGRALFYSLLGMGLLVVFGLTGIQQMHPEWLTSIPANRHAQVAIFAGLIVFTTSLQWLLTRERKRRKPAGVTGKKPPSVENDEPGEEQAPANAAPKKITPPPPPKWALNPKPAASQGGKARDDRNQSGRMLEM